jgi:hypothetical protein
MKDGIDNKQIFKILSTALVLISSSIASLKFGE